MFKTNLLKELVIRFLMFNNDIVIMFSKKELRLTIWDLLRVTRKGRNLVKMKQDCPWFDVCWKLAYSYVQFHYTTLNNVCIFLSTFRKNINWKTSRFSLPTEETPTSLHQFCEGANSWPSLWGFKLAGCTSWKSSPCWCCPGGVMYGSAWQGCWSNWRGPPNWSGLGWNTGDSQMQKLEF